MTEQLATEKPHGLQELVLDLSGTFVPAPPTPSKWDVIPIHTSDRGTFKFCRRQWAWSSPSRLNLVPKAAVHGIREYFWFGDGIHYALERMYNPLLRQDPEVTWLAWFDLQWNGGIVTADEVKAFVDREPEVVQMTIKRPSEQMYRVQGLEDILPFPDEEHFMELRDLGAGMMRFYRDYAAREDAFSVIATEHDFSVPILDPKTGRPYYKTDKRVMPDEWEPSQEENVYGKLMMPSTKGVVKQVHARGRMDMIVQDQEHGRFGILDHKTTSRLDDDYFRHLELDEQCTTYLWAGELEAKMYDLEYKNLEFITYEAILKGYPKPPTMTQRGLPSINRNDETTTAQLFEQCIRDYGLQPIFDSDQKMQSYYTWLLEQGDKRYINRTDTWRNKTQRENAGIRMYYEARDMLSDPITYPNPTKNYGCLNCVFRGPCIAAETGADYVSMLENGYQPNWDR